MASYMVLYSRGWGISPPMDPPLVLAYTTLALYVRHFIVTELMLVAQHVKCYITSYLCYSMSLRKKRKPDTAKLNLVSSRSNSIHISRLSIPILPSTITSNSCSLHNSPNISQAQSSVASDADTETAFEDVGHSSHDLSEDIDRHSGITRSHKGRQLKLAEGWSSVRDCILDGMVQQAALPPDVACHLCGKEASVICCQCGPHAYLCISCAEELHMSTNLFHTPLCWQVRS